MKKSGLLLFAILWGFYGSAQHVIATLEMGGLPKSDWFQIPVNIIN